MQIRTSTLTLVKRHALTISRGTSAGSENLLIEVEHEGLCGFGEMAPVRIDARAETAETARRDIERWVPDLVDLAPYDMQRIETHLDRAGGGIAARAGLDLALHDWLGKRCGMPLYRLLGADLRAIAPTSVTIGIQAPERACLRAGELIREGARVLKIKLGGGEGLRADRAMFDAVRSAAPPDVRLRVDANGGWTLRDAREMIPWLADRGVEYVEQPLPRGSEGDMPALHKEATIPLFADESCRVASDIPALADRVHGVNLKLMKAGGIREGLRLIHTARAHGLMVMLGCMSESSLAIAASVHLSPLADYLDLDSHLNLVSDPCCGLRWESGCVTPSNRPGLGVSPLGR